MGARPQREMLYGPFHDMEKAKLQGQEATRAESECWWRLRGQVHLLKFIEPWIPETGDFTVYVSYMSINRA